MEEEWRAVPGYEGLYEVSNLGRVMGYRGKILTPSKAGDGYWKVTLCKQGAPNLHVYVHRLVLRTFRGDAPGKVAMHLNHNRSDNRIENLKWGSHQENTQDMVRAKRHAEQRKTHCPRGHPLKDPNLVASEKRSGTRKCRACNIARARMQRNKNITLQEASDLAFQQIERGEV